MALPIQRICDTGGTRIGWAVRHAHQWVAFSDRHRDATEHETLSDATEAVRRRSLDPAPGLSHRERDVAQTVEAQRWLEKCGVQP